MDRAYILKLLNAQININGHIIGAAVGSGMTAKYAVMGGADFLLALSAGKYRIMGRSSYASYFCYGNNNDIVMDMGTHELLPIIGDKPILFGLLANDPQIHLYEYLKQIKESGFSGIVNFPTMSLIDGKFRQVLEEEHNNFTREVEAIKIANVLNMFTIAFVTTKAEAEMMLEAGADVICVHLGLTKGGFLGAKKALRIEDAGHLAEEIFNFCIAKNSSVIRMIYAGPANTPDDLQYMYRSTHCQGYIGGSTFDRIPTEKAILDTTKAFKAEGNAKTDAAMQKAMDGKLNPGDYTSFVKQYIEAHYMNDVQLGDLALVVHISQSYLSNRFRKETGISFTQYLMGYRMDKAKKLLRGSNDSCSAIAEQVGYTDYPQFSRMFKKREGISPSEYQKKFLDHKRRSL